MRACARLFSFDLSYPDCSNCDSRCKSVGECVLTAGMLCVVGGWVGGLMSATHDVRMLGGSLRRHQSASSIKTPAALIYPYVARH